MKRKAALRAQRPKKPSPQIAAEPSAEDADDGPADANGTPLSEGVHSDL